MMGRFDQKRGFTIIEVALVLAIAGLIFLMVFIALPNLQRQARDTERREDMTALINAIKKYQTNNRGVLPTDWSKAGDFWAGYLQSEFKDPNGADYDIVAEVCTTTGSANECDQTIGLSDVSFPNDYKVIIVTKATCDGGTAMKAINPRRAAVLYKLEGVGAYCGEV